MFVCMCVCVCVYNVTHCLSRRRGLMILNSLSVLNMVSCWAKGVRAKIDVTTIVPSNLCVCSKARKQNETDGLHRVCWHLKHTVRYVVRYAGLQALSYVTLMCVTV